MKIKFYSPLIWRNDFCSPFTWIRIFSSWFKNCKNSLLAVVSVVLILGICLSLSQTIFLFDGQSGGLDIDRGFFGVWDLLNSGCGSLLFGFRIVGFGFLWDSLGIINPTDVRELIIVWYRIHCWFCGKDIIFQNVRNFYVIN